MTFTSPKSASESHPVLFETERRDEFIRVIGLIPLWLATPLYLVFWAADWLFAREHIWTFLALRLSVAPVSFVVDRMVKRAKSAFEAQFYAVFLTFWTGNVITAMIVILGEPSTPYYAGLNLVCLVGVAFLPWRDRFLYLAIAVVYLPYLAWASYVCVNEGAPESMLLPLLFSGGTAFISVVVRRFNNSLRKREFENRQLLAQELSQRNEVVSAKTRESVQLKELSRQFSPQIVHAIKAGKLHLHQKVHRANIAAIFVDVVNSTERITRLDKDSLDLVISKFMDDTFAIMVKYDLTIDKFLGDGILAFSNDPMPHPDYIERTLLAALEIRRTIGSAQEFYRDYWLQDFKIRIGIAVGFANVGFYGKGEIFKSYTAIGPVVNLAARLCSRADPGTIVVSNEVRRAMASRESFRFGDLGVVSLKGFEHDIIRSFSLDETERVEGDSVPEGSEYCPACNSIMHLDVDASGFYVFRCRDCESARASHAAVKVA